MPMTPRPIPPNQKILRPESKVIDVITSPTSRKTSARSNRSARFRSCHVRSPTREPCLRFPSVRLCSAPPLPNISLRNLASAAASVVACTEVKSVNSLIRMPPDILRLIVGPLIGRLGLQHDFFCVGSVSQQETRPQPAPPVSPSSPKPAPGWDRAWHAPRVPAVRSVLPTLRHSPMTFTMTRLSRWPSNSA